MKVQKKLWGVLLAVTLTAQTISLIPITEAQASVVLNASDILTSGAVMKTYTWTSKRGSNDVSTTARVIEVDLTNPNVKLDMMTGIGGKYTFKQSVLNMVKETGAVAGVNGDFFNTQAEGVPIGPEISNGKLLATTPDLVSGLYSFALTKDNQPIVDLFAFKGSITAKDNSTYPIGGVNKTYYWYDDGTHSHTDGMFLYTNTWALDYRSNDGVSVPTEVKVQKGVITQIEINGVIKEVAPEDGYILRAAGKSAEYVKTHLKVGDPLKVDYSLVPQDPNKQYDTKNFKMMVGGHSILVDEGKASTFSRSETELEGFRSRTAIGYSKDMKTAYLVTADRSTHSDGLALPELQDLMVNVGVWKGMNLDGGASTQLVTRPLGETTPVITNITEFGGQRDVVNSVGVFSLAPKGKLTGLVLHGPKQVFLGEKAAFSVKGYDEYYNPVALDSSTTPQLNTSNALGKIDGMSFTASSIGTTTLTASAGLGTVKQDVKVAGRDDLSSLKLTTSNPMLKANTIYDLKITATDLQGRSSVLPSDAVKWEVLGPKSAKVENGQLTVNDINNVKDVRVIARYDGFSTMLTLNKLEETPWYDLDQYGLLTTSDVYPAEVKGTIRIVKDTNANKSLQLEYDFTDGKGNKAVYADFNGKNGSKVGGTPQLMKVKVSGDNSGNWVRSEIVDGDGKLTRLDFTKNMNWTGWKELTVNLEDYKVKYPITVKNIYVTSPAEGQDERALKGSVQFDDISFVSKTTTDATAKKQVKMTIGKNMMTIAGKTVKLDQAPLVTDNRTMVPVRVITEALGGQVKWNAKEQQVTIDQGDKLMDMWIGRKDMIFTGKRIISDAAPQLTSSGRTMVPLRQIAEALNWKVTWDEKTQTITLES
ncbi:stalk domain-containing protein [Paenibacillus sp. N1-5-1-14]|uniref:stalk domain-containing protein n=1 Tax=Paenibacillus radicibacter TaxID=2972488 RepID=UPI00215941A6|nr:stalk domain-containing protein [Paenibacillus radicibacter]MCR8641042.1 stalk domain-containing protein [Paenibacillus radicibacter]